MWQSVAVKITQCIQHAAANLSKLQPQRL